MSPYFLLFIKSTLFILLMGFLGLLTIFILYGTFSIVVEVGYVPGMIFATLVIGIWSGAIWTAIVFLADLFK